jgi:hypothetical protein
MAGGTFGAALERARTSQGLSVEAAAAKAKLTPEQWRALEIEHSATFTFAPSGYAAAAQAHGMKWTLVRA